MRRPWIVVLLALMALLSARALGGQGARRVVDEQAKPQELQEGSSLPDSSPDGEFLPETIATPEEILYDDEAPNDFDELLGPNCNRCNRGPACGRCGGGGNQGSPWFLWAEATALVHNRPAHKVSQTHLDHVTSRYLITLFVNTNPPTPVQGALIAQSVHDFSFIFAPGTRLTLGRYLGTDLIGRVHSTEFSFLGLNRWRDSHQITGGRELFGIIQNGVPTIIQTGNLFSPFPQNTGGFNRADFHRLEYASNLTNYEWNYRVRRPLTSDRWVGSPSGEWHPECVAGCTPSFLVGLRSISITEAFSFLSGANVLTLTPDFQSIASSFESRGAYLIRTTNNLFGGQIGGDLLYQDSTYNFGVRGKTGLFANFATQSSDISTVDTSTATNISRSFGARAQALAWVGEFGFVGSWQVGSHLALRASYDFLWIQGLALAPRQLNFTPGAPAKVSTGYFTSYHGPSLGVELTW